MSTLHQNGVALITGASSGIGATYADRLARRGYDLILVARDRDRLGTLAQKLIAEYGVAAETLKADLTLKSDLARVEQRLREDDGIVLLVNNAGAGAGGGLVGADLDRLEAMIQLNIVAPTRLAGAVVGGFVERAKGTIINISSVLALAPELDFVNGSYGGTKAYLLNFTQSLQQEVGAKGVRVQAVLPGATRTEIWERSGLEIGHLPDEMLMAVGDLVDAALAGLDLGETITIPSLPDMADWDALTAARVKLGPNLSRNHPAERYQVRA